jgi:histidyl-tRNA synthetase
VKKVSIPSGTRDYSPAAMARRRYIFNTIEEIFRVYGYRPIETPAMENLDTLLGKYGEEGDKLLFKILNSGNFMDGLKEGDLKSENAPALSSRICEKGLRYDLTVPFARYVVQHRNEINFPFKRYQIQPVWRADRPQKGRYREFYQCDVDIIGSKSLLNELELLEIIERVFGRLRIGIKVKINHRGILAGIAEVLGEEKKLTEITTALDKIEKIGVRGVIRELEERGVPGPAIKQLQPILGLEGPGDEKLAELSKILDGSEKGMEGVRDMTRLFDYIGLVEFKSPIQFDLTLARGLDYYTGAIIEVLAQEIEIGSICGGGRYDDLAGIFGLDGVSGVGISFGADRIYDVLDQLDLFPEEVSTGTRLLFVNFGEAEQRYVLHRILPYFRSTGIPCELFPEGIRLQKQMSYAHRNGIPYVALIGGDEMTAGKLKLRDMGTGKEEYLSREEAINLLLGRKVK